MQFLRRPLALLALATLLGSCGSTTPAAEAPTTASTPAANTAPATTSDATAAPTIAPTMAMGNETPAPTMALGGATPAPTTASGMDMGGAMPMTGTMTMGGTAMPMGGMDMATSEPVPTLTPGPAAAIPAAQPDLAAFPVTVENCGRTLTFKEPPERVVPLYPLTAEFLLRLGLQSRIVGVAFSESEPVAPDLRTAFAALPVITTDAAPNKEVLLTARPDFVLDNFPGLFYNAAQGAATVEELKANGAEAYTLTSRCTGNEANGKVADIYTDIANLGKIFGISGRAQQLIDQLKGRVAAVQAKIAGKPKLRMLVYDSGVGPINVYGPGAIADVAVLAGGVNVFPDGDSEFLMLSAEEVAARDPEVFVVFDRPGARQMSMGADLNAQEAADFLITNVSEHDRRQEQARGSCAVPAGLRRPTKH